MVQFGWMKLCVSIYPKVIGGLIENIIENIPGIFLKKSGKIMEFCHSRNVGTLSLHVCKRCEEREGGIVFKG